MLTQRSQTSAPGHQHQIDAEVLALSSGYAVELIKKESSEKTHAPKHNIQNRQNLRRHRKTTFLLGHPIHIDRLKSLVCFAEREEPEDEAKAEDADDA